MFTIHPERWHSNPVLWTKELIWQNVKNVVKRFMVHRGQKSEVGDQSSALEISKE